MQLIGVEYVVIAEARDAKNNAPPVLMGQLLQYAGSPNRYGFSPPSTHGRLGTEQNPGTFLDWNQMSGVGSQVSL